MDNVRTMALSVSFLLFSFLIAPLAHATCGRVPVYCVVETKTAPGTFEYTTEQPPSYCVATHHKSGYAGPICQVDVDSMMVEYYKRCDAAYTNNRQRVVGLAYFKGGDPYNPANVNEKRMHGHYYSRTHFRNHDLKSEGTPNVHPRKGCDLITD